MLQTITMSLRYVVSFAKPRGHLIDARPQALCRQASAIRRLERIHSPSSTLERFRRGENAVGDDHAADNAHRFTLRVALTFSEGVSRCVSRQYTIEPGRPKSWRVVFRHRWRIIILASPCRALAPRAQKYIGWFSLVTHLPGSSDAELGQGTSRVVICIHSG